MDHYPADTDSNTGWPDILVAQRHHVTLRRALALVGPGIWKVDVPEVKPRHSVIKPQQVRGRPDLQIYQFPLAAAGVAPAAAAAVAVGALVNHIHSDGFLGSTLHHDLQLALK